jgi:magnesium-transporting ATPase (P-type)
LCTHRVRGSFFVNEATLTGESYRVEKSANILPRETPLRERTNSIFMGIFVVSGTSKVLVIKTRSMNVLCSDKTGTLSIGEVKLQSAIDVEGNTSKRFFFMPILIPSMKLVFQIRLIHPSKPFVLNNLIFQDVANWMKLHMILFVNG